MGVEGQFTKGKKERARTIVETFIWYFWETTQSLTLLELWKLTFDVDEKEHSF